MDISKVKELAELMKETDLSKLKIEESGLKLVLERGCRQAVQIPTQQTAVNFVENGDITNQSLIAASGEKEGLITVRSPMVGVFYTAPSPGEKAYATVGDRIRKGDVLCIIEAMKLMNEINAECDGEVVEVCAGNGQVVEFDQPLFRLRCEDE